MTHHPERLARMALVNCWEVTPEPRRKRAAYDHPLVWTSCGVLLGLIIAGVM